MNLNSPIQFIDNFSCCDFKQVERVFGASHPDPLEIEKAKKVLRVRSAVFVFLVVVADRSNDLFCSEEMPSLLMCCQLLLV